MLRQINRLRLLIATGVQQSLNSKQRVREVARMIKRHSRSNCITYSKQRVREVARMIKRHSCSKHQNVILKITNSSKCYLSSAMHSADAEHVTAVNQKNIDLT